MPLLTSESMRTPTELKTTRRRLDNMRKCVAKEVVRVRRRLHDHSARGEYYDVAEAALGDVHASS